LKWAASHRAPRRYGTKVSSEITGKDGAPIKIASDHDQVKQRAG